MSATKGQAHYIITLMKLKNRGQSGVRDTQACAKTPDFWFYLVDEDAIEDV